jgi:hypothetical protein
MSESFATITFDNGEVEASSENTALYTHIGRHALLDHVWIDTGNGYGTRIWSQIPPDNSVYHLLAPLVVKSGAELHLNIREPNKSDQESFDKAVIADIDTRPDWL